MLNLLSRFYDPDSGSVRVGGVEAVGAAQGRPAHGRRARHAAARAVLAAAARQPLRRAARRDRGGDARGLRGRRRGGLHRRPAGRLRHAHRRARRQPLGRPAPARRARARADLERARARARRPALGGRHRDRGAHRARAAPGARRPHGAAREPAPLDRRAGRPRGRARGRRDRRGRAAEAPADAPAARSSASSGTRSVSRKRRVGLTRLSVYVGDQRARIALLALAAAFTSAVQVGGWLLVGDAIDNGIRAQDTGAARPRRRDLRRRQRGGLARRLVPDPRPRAARPADRAAAARAPLRPPHDALAALLLGAARGLDHLAHHERRRRALRRALGGALDARRQRADADGRDDRAGASSTGGWRSRRW